MTETTDLNKKEKTMLTIDRIDHLNMGVKNLQQTQAFYKKLFDFDILETGQSRLNQAPYAIIGKSGKGVLCIYERGSNKSRTEDYGDIAINHWGFHIENFDEALHAVKTLNVPYEYDGVIHQGQSRSLYIIDPNGYEIELTEKLAGGL